MSNWNEAPTEEIGELVEDLIFRAGVCARNNCPDGPTCETYLAKKRLYSVLAKRLSYLIQGESDALYFSLTPDQMDHLIDGGNLDHLETEAAFWLNVSTLGKKTFFQSREQAVRSAESNISTHTTVAAPLYLNPQQKPVCNNCKQNICIACDGEGDLPDAPHAWDCGENPPECWRCKGSGVEPHTEHHQA